MSVSLYYENLGFRVCKGHFLKKEILFRGHNWMDYSECVILNMNNFSHNNECTIVNNYQLLMADTD